MARGRRGAGAGGARARLKRRHAPQPRRRRPAPHRPTTHHPPPPDAKMTAPQRAARLPCSPCTKSSPPISTAPC
ncbi:hypothetical protein BMD20_19700 [Burkholderia multivorans]|nr:hypothetical protein BMD22_27665 [Burkholderia multivorans]KHS11974.1 hypothetical protein BMD20_19700 [Burkholderia multivorans]